jgi:hypothetical protein
MSTYIFPRITGTGALSLEACRKLPSVALQPAFGSRGNPLPHTTAALCALDNGLMVFMETAETHLRAKCDTPNGQVHLDSCMEFFMTFDRSSGPEYLNFEVNALGCLHVKIGPDRYTRTPAEYGGSPRRFFDIHVGIEPGGWWLRYVIPYEFGRKYYPGFQAVEAADLAGNFYKCGDETESPHLGFWNPVVVEKPDFHRPDWFGKLSVGRDAPGAPHQSAP